MRITFLFIFGFYQCILWAQQPCEYFRTYIDAGDRLLNEEDYISAVDSFTVALLYCPDSAEVAREKIRGAFIKIEALKTRAEDLAKANDKARKDAIKSRDDIEKLLKDLQKEKEDKECY